MSPTQVPQLDFEADPLFVLVQRDPKRRRRLVGYEVALHEDIFDELRAIAGDSLEKVKALEEREYEPTAELERGEQCFSINVAALPSPQVPLDSAGDHSTADLIAIVSNPTGLEALGAADLTHESYLAYGIVLPDNAGNRLGFFRQDDPARPLRRGRLFGRFTDALRRVTQPPDLILYPDIDVVVTAERILVTRKDAFRKLLADVDIALAEVDQSVSAVASALGKTMPLAGGMAETIRAVAAQRPSFALRLRALSSRAHQLSDDGVTGKRIRESISEVDGDPDELLNGQDEFEFGDKSVGAFLDVLEGRWFKDPLGGEPRRADRYSRRS